MGEPISHVRVIPPEHTHRKRSKVTLTDAVIVEIRGRRGSLGEGFTMSSDELASRFLHFLANQPDDADYIWEHRGFGSCGLGNYVGVFPPEFKERIEAWFKANR